MSRRQLFRHGGRSPDGLRALPSRGATAPTGSVPVGGRRPVVVLRSVSKTYNTGAIEVQALRRASLSVEAGDFVAIMGASGSGKSTMMNIIGCLDVPTRGHYWLEGVDVRELEELDLSRIRNRKIGFVFQNYNLIPRTTAVANVELALAYGGVKPKERHARAMAALRQVGLEDRSRHLPSEMSGGQQQRVAIARALVTAPALILADEPTGNLDTASSNEVMAIFSRLNAEGRTVVIITHEQDIASFARRIIRLRDGQIYEDSRIVPVHSETRMEQREAPGDAAPASGNLSGSSDMNVFDNLRVAIGGISSNKLRSVLTTLGVLIGVAAVIILVAVGTGSSQAVESRINQLGTNTLTVFNTGRFGRGAFSSGTQTQQATLTIADVNTLENPNNAPDVKSVSPVVSTSETATYGAATYTTTVEGSTPSYLSAEDYTVQAGSPISSQDVSISRPGRRHRV